MKTLYHTHNLNFKKLIKGLKKEGGKRKSSNHPFFYHEFMTFDIEATNIPEIKQACMYIWQLYFNGYVIIGRTWKEFIYFIEKLNDYAKYDIVCYVHNLSYEFAFIRNLFQWDSVKIIRNHTILSCDYKKIHFRCSYLLIHMSLEKFCKRMGTETQKLSGDVFDYSKKRYYNTKIKRYDLQYCINDVVGLYQGLRKYLTLENKNLYNIPLTSTGFPRKELKNAVRRYLGKNYHVKRNLNLPQYILCNRCFRGGNTHANKYYVGQILKNIYSSDIKSSYPAQLVLRKYPVSPFSAIYEYTQKEIETLIDRGKSALMLQIYFEDLKLIDRRNSCPYISLHKLGKPKGFILDNGRVLKCDSGVMYVTDIDYTIIKAQYFFNIKHIQGCGAKYGYLPQPYIDTVLHYFTLKETEKDPYFYARAKEKLNALYGVMVTAILRDNIVYEDGEFKLKPVDKEKEIDENKQKNVLQYQHGVFCTSHARKELQDVIDICGYDFVYCDTDSVKFKNYKHLEEIEEYNQKIRELAAERKVIVNNKVMGVFEFEECYKRFVTLGSKKYAYTDRFNNLHLTLAGVKKEGVKELKDIHKFKNGFIFKKYGGTEGRYNDYYGKYKVNEHLEIEISENLYLQQHEYKLGHSKDYKFLLDCMASGEYNYLWE